MADYFYPGNTERDLHRYDWLKLAAVFALFALMMLAVMCLAVFLASPH